MKNAVEQMIDFHTAFGHPVNVMAKFPDNKERELRTELLKEEYIEYTDAEIDNDLVEVADALGDMLVVILGTGLSYGLDMNAIFNEIMSNNMSKLGDDGKPIKRADGKILKPEKWVPPNIKGVM